ncbi:hypothetical protein ACFVTP_05270 [Streptomyces celluloflavus]
MATSLARLPDVRNDQSLHDPDVTRTWRQRRARRLEGRVAAVRAAA